MEESSTHTDDYPAFKQKLLDTKMIGKSGEETTDCRYAVYNLEYKIDSGEDKRYLPSTLALIPHRCDHHVYTPGHSSWLQMLMVYQ